MPEPPKTRTFMGPFIILLGIVFASGLQTEVASYVAQKLQYDKPYFSFFVTHVTFSFVFPVHLAVLSLSHGFKAAPVRAKQLLRNLRAVLADQLGTSPRWRQLYKPLLVKIIPLTFLISFPALCWFVAMALSPAMDITAIYATSAFHTYFFSLLLLGTRLTRTTVAAIGVAFAGVMVLTLDGTAPGDTAKNRVVGDIIMVVGAAALGLYEVVYKMVLPESEGGSHRKPGDHASSPILARVASALPRVATPPPEESATDAEDDDDDDDRIALGRAAGAHTPLLAKSPSAVDIAHAQHRASGSRSSSSISRIVHPHHVPQLPTAFHSNFLTSCLGVATFVLLWVPFPLLHLTGIEEFVWPSSPKLGGALVVVASMGAIYVSRQVQ